MSSCREFYMKISSKQNILFLRISPFTSLMFICFSYKSGKINYGKSAINLRILLFCYFSVRGRTRTKTLTHSQGIIENRIYQKYRCIVQIILQRMRNFNQREAVRPFPPHQNERVNPIQQWVYQPQRVVQDSNRPLINNDQSFHVNQPWNMSSMNQRTAIFIPNEYQQASNRQIDQEFMEFKKFKMDQMANLKKIESLAYQNKILKFQNATLKKMNEDLLKQMVNIKMICQKIEINNHDKFLRSKSHQYLSHNLLHQKLNPSNQCQDKANEVIVKCCQSCYNLLQTPNKSRNPSNRFMKKHRTAAHSLQNREPLFKKPSLPIFQILEQRPCFLNRQKTSQDIQVAGSRSNRSQPLIMHANSHKFFQIDNQKQNQQKSQAATSSSFRRKQTSEYSDIDEKLQKLRKENESLKKIK